MRFVSVLLVDDHPVFLRIATNFLEEHCKEDVVVAGTATGGEEGLSCHEANGYRRAALAAGADDFVSKFAVNTDLLPAIRRVMHARRPRGRAGVSPGAVTS